MSVQYTIVPFCGSHSLPPLPFSAPSLVGYRPLPPVPKDSAQRCRTFPRVMAVQHTPSSPPAWCQTPYIVPARQRPPCYHPRHWFMPPWTPPPPIQRARPTRRQPSHDAATFQALTGDVQQAASKPGLLALVGRRRITVGRDAFADRTLRARPPTFPPHRAVPVAANTRQCDTAQPPRPATGHSSGGYCGNLPNQPTSGRHCSGRRGGAAYRHDGRRRAVFPIHW